MIKKTLLVLIFLMTLNFAATAQITASQPKYLGKLASDPNCTQTGAQYFNTTINLPKVCTASGTPGTWTALGIVPTGDSTKFLNGAGVFSAPAGGGSSSPGWTIVNKSANYSVTAADSGTLFTNVGTGAIITFALPTTGLTAGSTKLKFVQLATRGITIDPSGFVVYGFDSFNTDMQFVTTIISSSPGANCELLYLGNNSWLFTGAGNWTDQ